MPAGIPPKISVSSFMGYLRGKSSLLMFGRHANLKYEFGNRKFWAEGRCVSTVGLNGATAAKCIREQERADIAQDGLSVKEHGDPFARGPQGRWARRRFDRPATSQGAIGLHPKSRPPALRVVLIV